jgi:galactoside O-acetyltransferase
MSSPPNIFFDLRELAALGEGAIIGRTVRIRKPDRCSIGAHSIIDDFSYISCALRVGRYTHIGAQAVVIGGEARVEIGDFVNIAPGCRLVASSHDFTEGGLTGPAIPPEFSAPAVVSHVKIADHALLGAGTIVLPGVEVPEGAATGAYTLLTPKIKLEPWTLYVGVPARPLRARAREAILDAARRLLSARGTTP